MNESKGGSGFVAGFLMGGVAGAALALLLAPGRGDENWELLRERSIELRTRAEEAAARAREEADELLARSKTILEEQKSRVQEAVDEGRDVASQKKSELLSRYRIAKETGESPIPEDTVAPEQRPESATE